MTFHSLYSNLEFPSESSDHALESFNSLFVEALTITLNLHMSIQWPFH